MVVSFTISKKGARYTRKLQQSTAPVAQEDSDSDGGDGDVAAAKPSDSIKDSTAACLSQANDDVAQIPDSDVSFTLNLFPDGYSFGKFSENDLRNQTSLLEVLKLLNPYDRISDTLLSAIESGRLPGDVLDGIPCKYIDGSIVCEVRDYRNCISESGIDENSSVVTKVRLRMSLENVVKDISLIADDSWTYGDLMEVESRIVKALEPQLCLDPTPNLDRLCDSPVSSKLNFATCRMRRKRVRQLPEATFSNNKFCVKKICNDGVPENSNFRMADTGPTVQQQVNENFSIQNSGPSSMLPLRSKTLMPDASVPTSSLVSHQSKYQIGAGNSRIYQDHGAVPILNAPGESLVGQDILSSYTDNMNTTVSSSHGKRENQDGQLSPMSSLNKRPRLPQVGSDGGQQQHIGQHMDGYHGPESHWKNTLLQQQTIGRGLHYTNPSMQRYPQQMFEGGFSQEGGASPFTVGQQGVRYGLKEEPVEIERLEKPDLSGSKIEMRMMESEMNRVDPQQSRQQQRLSQMRSGFPQTQWNNLGQPLESISRKEDPFQKRKLVQSPRVSAGGLPQSPLSSKSGEFSSGSVGPHFGAVTGTAALGPSQKEKAVTSVHAIGGPTSLAASANDSMQRQHQAQNAAKRKSNSLTKAPLMSGVGSPASVGNMGVPLNASSPPVGTPALGDQLILDRFTKIDLVTSRFKLNSKKHKVDDHPIKKPTTYSAQQLMLHLSSDTNTENSKDESCKMPLSKSLVGGSMNVCKTRVLNFVPPDRFVQVGAKSRNRMIMSEKPNDGTVAMHYGEIEDADYLAAEDYLPTLPNTHIADLLAAQICSMMIREGYTVEDHVQPKPVHMNRPPNSYSNVTGIPTNASAIEMHSTEAVSTQPSNDMTKPSNSGIASLNSSQNIMSSSRMLPSGNTQPLQMSQGLLAGGSMPSRMQQPEVQSSLQQQQQHHQNQHSLLQQQQHQFQRSPMMLAANPLSHLNTLGQNSNIQMGNQMVNKTSLQLQMLQQQQQQQIQPQMQRKMMMGLGNVGMGNMGNNMVGLQGLGNMMGMGASRGVGGAGISAPMGSISGLSNVGQNPLNVSQASNISNSITHQLRTGQLTPAQAALVATKFRMQNRTNMLSSGQSNIGGMSGARQMNPGSTGLSMLGSTLNRAAINPMQRTGMGPMGPPKLMANMNVYMNQQQQQQQLQLTPQQLQQLQQQQLQHHHHHQQQQQQQDTTSPLQAVVSPPQVGSPSSMVIQQQLNPQSQQQQQQDSSQQMSQRTPMSPQLSSGAMHPLSAGNQEGGPASPQLSSQTLGSVGSITNSSMDLQGGNKSTSAGNS